MNSLMPLLYDWDKIFSATEGNSVEIVRILRMLVANQIPDNYNDPIYKYYIKDFGGKSFLVNGDILLLNSHKHTYKDMAMYLSLASLRPLAEWAASGKVDLPAIVVPVAEDTLIKYIELNPLLSLKDGNIHFLYEDSDTLTIH